MIPRVLMPLPGYLASALRCRGRGSASLRAVLVLATFGQLVDIPTWMLEAFFAAGVLEVLERPR